MVKKIIEYLEKISNLTIKQLLKVFAFGVCCVVLGYAYNVFTNKEYAPKLTEKLISKMESEEDGMDLRNSIAPSIQRKLIEITVKLKCDRAFILEGHNGKENLLHLPFQYYDMTFEEANEELHSKYVSDSYQNMLTTHYQFPNYVASQTHFVGTIDELNEIDRKISEKIKSDNGVYIAMVPLEYKGKIFGVIGATYDATNPNPIPAKEVIVTTLFHYAEIVSPQLRLVMQNDKNK